MLCAAVAHLHEELSLKALLALKAEKFVICSVFTRRPTLLNYNIIILETPNKKYSVQVFIIIIIVVVVVVLHLRESRYTFFPFTFVYPTSPGL
jgi:hypothetical protein